MCGKMEAGKLRCGSIFILCHALLKNAILLHIEATVRIFIGPSVISRTFDYTANISAVLSTVNCGVTFPTVIWQYSELLMTLSCCGYCHQRY